MVGYPGVPGISLYQSRKTATIKNANPSGPKTPIISTVGPEESVINPSQSRIDNASFLKLPDFLRQGEQQLLWIPSGCLTSEETYPSRARSFKFTRLERIKEYSFVWLFSYS